MNAKNKMNNCWLVIVFNLILMTNIVLASSTKIFPVQKDLRNSNMTNLYTGHGKVILTFDDGPHPRTTPYLLDILSKYKIKATFFMLGENIKKYPKIVERVEQEGHIIANHTFSHQNIAKFKKFQLKKKLKIEFFNTHQEIIQFAPYKKEYFFRAPYGAWQKRAAKIINKTDIGKDYIGPIYWDIGGSIELNSNGSLRDAADWNCWSKKMPIDKCLQGYLNKIVALDGGVILMHDLNIKTAKMVEKMIPQLIGQGFIFTQLNQIGLRKE